MTSETVAGVPLTDLDVGARAQLRTTQLDEQTRSLLRALGLIDGSPLRVCKRGEPFIIQVRTTRIGVSQAVAAGLYVLPSNGTPPNGHHGPQRTGS